MLCERRWVKESVSMTGLISRSARSMAAGRTKPSRLNMPASARSLRHRSTSACHCGEPGLSRGNRSRSRMSRTSTRSHNCEYCTFDQDAHFLKTSRSYPGSEKLGLECLDLLLVLTYR